VSRDALHVLLQYASAASNKQINTRSFRSNRHGNSVSGLGLSDKEAWKPDKGRGELHADADA